MKDNELRGRILEKLYETRHQQKRVNVTTENDPFNEITDSYDVTISILRQLAQHNYIEWTPRETASGYIMFASCIINARGIDVVEWTASSEISIVINGNAVSLQVGNQNVINNNNVAGDNDINV